MSRRGWFVFRCQWLWRFHSISCNPSWHSFLFSSSYLFIDSTAWSGRVRKRREDQQAPLQANREYATLIFHRVLKKTLWAIIGLTTVTMGTGVSGVDWQVTQSEGWLTSETEVQPLKSVKQPGGNNMAAASERVHKLVHLKEKKNISNARLMYKAVRAWLLIQIAFVWLK